MLDFKMMHYRHCEIRLIEEYSKTILPKQDTCMYLTESSQKSDIVYTPIKVHFIDEDGADGLQGKLVQVFGTNCLNQLVEVVSSREIR